MTDTTCQPQPIRALESSDESFESLEAWTLRMLAEDRLDCAKIPLNLMVPPCHRRH
jgi:hypothetical protein